MNDVSRHPSAVMPTDKLAVYTIPYVLIAALQYQATKDGLRFADPMTFMAARYVLRAREELQAHPQP